MKEWVELECFQTSVNTINAWCYADPPVIPGYFLAYMDHHIEKISLDSGIPYLLLVQITLVPGYA